MTAQIRCADLVRIYTAVGVEVQALQGLTLDVEKGELTAIVGASGSGKSTLLGILSGLDTPTAGRAQVADHDLLTMTGRERTRYRRETVGFVFQQTARNLLPYYTAAQNIALALALAHRPRRGRAERVDELLGLLGIAEVRDRRPAEMSGASSSAWRSPSRSPTSPRCCWPTSRRASSTRPTRCSCSKPCATSTSASA
ncbi:hypothetical protein GCM10025869_37020 [Homoserinibacter gongjuensis]|uniref:ABC transporter domain-containing protein n=1 Tax=Homoserinibacter gongjuensis TaxID=1162968 RepID=A0ABQ6JMM0_9MICO|nr:hypothetical protein GCM10025869_00610 [Homoserinibacter gongjuensis]GMA93173.1 hypothetical protein GCM10025869_37020 [Homoserinibacter gongjuensis]